MLFLLLNKVDLTSTEETAIACQLWKNDFPHATIVPFSAKFNMNVEDILQNILEHLPESKLYFGKEDWIDKPERFWNRSHPGKTLLNYKQEIPYSC